MKKPLPPEWTEREQSRGREISRAWEDFFSDAKTASPDLETEARLAAVRSRHEDALLRYENVIGVSEGVRTRGGEPTGEPCLVVYVERKKAVNELDADQVIPSQLEGVPVDVVEVGEPQILPT